MGIALTVVSSAQAPCTRVRANRAVIASVVGGSRIPCVAVFKVAQPSGAGFYLPSQTRHVVARTGPIGRTRAERSIGRRIAGVANSGEIKSGNASPIFREQPRSRLGIATVTCVLSRIVACISVAKCSVAVNATARKGAGCGTLGLAAIGAATASPQGQATATDLGNFASASVDVMMGDTKMV